MKCSFITTFMFPTFSFFLDVTMKKSGLFLDAFVSAVKAYVDYSEAYPKINKILNFKKSDYFLRAGPMGARVKDLDLEIRDRRTANNLSLCEPS